MTGEEAAAPAHGRKPTEYFDADELAEALASDGAQSPRGHATVAATSEDLAHTQDAAEALSQSTDGHHIGRRSGSKRERVRRLFDLGPEHVFRDSFSCAIHKQIVIHGRLYVFSTCLAFHSNLFGKVRSYVFPFTDIASIKKRPVNSLQVVFREGVTKADGITPRKEEYFTSFANRERAARLAIGEFQSLFAIHPTSRPASHCSDLDTAALEDLDPILTEEVPTSAPVLHTSEDVAGLPARLHSAVEPVGHPLASRRPRSVSPDQKQGPPVPVPRATSYVMPQSGSLGDHRNEDEASGLDTSNDDMVSDDDHPETEDETPAEMADRVPSVKPMAWITPEDVLDKVHGAAYSVRQECCKVVLPGISPREAFNALFIDIDSEDGDFIVVARTTVGNQDVVATPWSREQGGSNANFRKRDINYVHPLKHRLGPKQTRCHEEHRYSFTSSGGFIYESMQHNLDVPYGDSFRVESFLDFEPTSTGDTQLTAAVAVNWVKSVSMMKKTIESGTLAGSKPALERVCQLASEWARRWAAARQIAPVATSLPLEVPMDQSRSQSGFGSDGIPAPNAARTVSGTSSADLNVHSPETLAVNAAVERFAEEQAQPQVAGELKAGSAVVQVREPPTVLGVDLSLVAQILLLIVLAGAVVLLVQISLAISEINGEMQAIRQAIERKIR